MEKATKHHWGKLIGVTLGCIMLAVAVVATVWADEVPTPVIAIAATDTNEFTITITNGVSFANYELYRRSKLAPLFPWTLHTIGSQGQTNFVAEMGLLKKSFFQIGVGNDWDQDGVPNYADANPTDSNVGALTITIDSPVNGAMFD